MSVIPLSALGIHFGKQSGIKTKSWPSRYVCSLWIDTLHKWDSSLMSFKKMAIWNKENRRKVIFFVKLIVRVLIPSLPFFCEGRHVALNHHLYFLHYFFLFKARNKHNILNFIFPPNALILLNVLPLLPSEVSRHLVWL